MQIDLTDAETRRLEALAAKLAEDGDAQMRGTPKAARVKVALFRVIAAGIDALEAR